MRPRKPSPQFLRALRIYEWASVGMATFGSILLASNISISGYAYPILLAATSAFWILAFYRNEKPTMVLWGVWTGIHIYGTLRWI